MTKEGKISAGELRFRGFKIPDSIPDCATVRYDAVRMEVGNVSTEGPVDGEILSIDISCSFDAPFEWVEISGTIET